MSNGLGSERMNDLRNRVKANRAINESVEPYSQDDMELEAFDAETLTRVEKASQKAK